MVPVRSCHEPSRAERCLAVLALALAMALLAGLGSAGRAAAEDRERLFLRALDAFDSGNFEQSALLFESILNDGYENGAVLYNLGNAHKRAGKVGEAIAAYRRAQKYRPRDPYLDANLKVALSEAAGALDAPSAPWWHRVLFWHTKLSQNERLWVGAAVWVLAFLMALIRLWVGPHAQRAPGLKWAIHGALAMGILLAISAGLGYRDDVLTKRGVVLDEVHARKGNGENYENAFDLPMKEGAEFTVVEARAGWFHVRFAGVGEGWLPEKDVAVY